MNAGPLNTYEEETTETGEIAETTAEKTLGSACSAVSAVSSDPSYSADAIGDRLAAIDWRGVDSSLDAQGFAHLPVVLDPDECQTLAGLYPQDARFRSRIDMSRFRFGVGEYKYFAAPLPPLIQSLREALYARLAPTANRWKVRLPAVARSASARPRRSSAAKAGSGGGKPDTTDAYPAALPEFLVRCRDAGQTRPTPLLLSYTAGGYNCLHQDIYGDLAFPLQAVFGLSREGTDYEGGEFLLVEQRPRAQSRGHAVRIEQGAGLIFATRERPAAGTRGDYRVTMRHGVSTVTAGLRMTLGVIFHDAR